MPYYIDGELRLTESAAIIRYVCEKHQPALLQPEGGRCGTTTARALHDQLFVFLLNHNAATRAFHYGYLPQVLGRLLCSAHPHTNIHAHAHAHVPLLDVIVTRTSCTLVSRTSCRTHQTNLRASKEKTGRTGSLTIEHAHSDETRVQYVLSD